MTWNINRFDLTRQPDGGRQVDQNNQINAGLMRMWNARSGLNLRDQVTATLSTFAGAPKLTATGTGLSFDATAAGTHASPSGTLGKVSTGKITVGALVTIGDTNRGDFVSRWVTGGNAGDQFDLLRLTGANAQFFISSGSGTANSGADAVTTLKTGNTYLIVGTWDGTTVRVYTNGRLGSSNAPGAFTMTAAPSAQTVLCDNANSDGHFLGQFYWGAIWNRALNPAEIAVLGVNPWQLYRPNARRLWLVVSTGPVNAVGSAFNTLQPLTEAAMGQIGAESGVTDNLQPFTAAATGTVGGAVIASAVGSLQPITEVATGRVGALTGITSVIRPFTGIAIGKVGAAGFAASNLQAMTESAAGESSAPPIQPSAPSGGAPAWWGYEGFDGTRRPWWYKDLKDKAKQLERLRKQRIEIGLLPPDELIEETLEFVEEIPTPATADYYISRYEALSARIEAYVDQIQEDDDEAVIVEMAKFFFPRNSAICWH